jgi:hypothetical protein
MGENKEVAKITTSELTGYLNWLRNEYVPHSFGSAKERLSPNTVRNVWITLSAFFTWVSWEFMPCLAGRENWCRRWMRFSRDCMSSGENAIIVIRLLIR